MTRHEKAQLFVDAWNKASHVWELIPEHGKNSLALYQRARNYRKKGVNLKHMPRGFQIMGRSKIDYLKLNH